jgi:hypothetical protein
MVALMPTQAQIPAVGLTCIGLAGPDPVGSGAGTAPPGRDVITA